MVFIKKRREVLILAQTNLLCVLCQYVNIADALVIVILNLRTKF
jgi:hypothetical protein